MTNHAYVYKTMPVCNCVGHFRSGTPSKAVHYWGALCMAGLSFKLCIAAYFDIEGLPELSRRSPALHQCDGILVFLRRWSHESRLQDVMPNVGYVGNGTAPNGVIYSLKLKHLYENLL